MKKFLLIGLAICLSSVSYGISINVDTVLAPNAYGSPSYATWAANAVQAQISGVSTYGASGPGQYNEVTGPIDIPVVTGFPSWMGMADPGTVFGPAYASELGNRAHFAFYIDGQGAQFSIAQLGFSATSTDPGNALGFSFATGSYNYSSQYVGILKGVDGILGTLDDVYITAGLNTQLVDGMAGRGSGNAFPIYDTDPGLTQQDKINGVLTKFELDGSPIDFIGTYTLGDASGSGVFHFNGSQQNSVPDGGSSLGMLFGAVCLMGCVRRKLK